jgi:hypothetical protein
MMNHVLVAVDFNILVNGLLSPTPTPTDPAPLALQQLWLIAMNGNLYKLVSSVGMLIAVFAVGFWCLKFYQALEEGTLKPAVNELIFPVILVILLSNSGDNMRKLTLTTRDIINNINISVNSVIDAEVSIRAANDAISGDLLSQMAVGRLYRQCVASADLNKIRRCADSTRLQVDSYTGGAAPARQVSSNSQYQAQLTKFAQKMQQRNASRYNQVVSDVTGSSQPNFNPSVLDASYYENDKSLEEITRTIMSFRVAFIYIVEVMMLITGLIGPIFLGLSLFPVGTKPLIAWGTSFLSLGFCKVCYTLISGLSSIAFVYAGPDNIDATTVAVVLGLLSPVLAFSIASGSGINSLNAINQTAQSGGLKIGLGYYPSSGGSASTAEINNNINAPR